MQAYAEGYELLARSGLDIDAKGALQRLAAGERRAVVAARPARAGPRAAPGPRRAWRRSPRTRARVAGRCRRRSSAAWPRPVISAALYARFVSQDHDGVAMKAIAALREQFGGHAVLPEDAPGEARPARRARRPGRHVSNDAPAVRRAGALRRHRRPGQEEDLPGRLRDDADRPRPRAGGRLRVVGVGRRPPPPARPRGHRGQGRRSTRRVWDDLAKRTSYVRGDYRDPESFAALADRLARARRRAPALLPGHPAGALRRRHHRPREPAASTRAPGSWSRSPSAATGPRPASSTRSSTAPSPRRTSSASTTSSARSRSRTCSCSASPTRCSSRCGTATSSPACRSRWRRTSASRAGAASTSRSARCATSCRTTCSRSWPCSPWSRRPAPTPARCATSAASCSARSARSSRRRSCAASTAATPTRTGVDAGSDVETFVALRLEIDSWRWAGRAVAHPHRQAPAGHRHRGGRRVQRAAPAAVHPAGRAGAAPQPPALPARARTTA